MNWPTANERVQPLLVDLEWLEGAPALSVELDGKEILNQRIETGRYQLESPDAAGEESQKERLPDSLRRP